MSARLLEIPDYENTYGPLLNSIEQPDFKNFFLLLSKLPIPVRFIAPEQVYSEQNFITGLHLLGSDIENGLIELNASSRDNNIFTYIFCVNICCEIDEDSSISNSCNVMYTWNCFTFETVYDHGDVIHDLAGHPFYSLSNLLQGIRETAH
jgi:hypothetical protein